MGLDLDKPSADVGFLQCHRAAGFTPQDRDAVLDTILPGSAATINEAEDPVYR